MEKEKEMWIIPDDNGYREVDIKFVPTTKTIKDIFEHAQSSATTKLKSKMSRVVED